MAHDHGAHDDGMMDDSMMHSDHDGHDGHDGMAEASDQMAGMEEPFCQGPASVMKSGFDWGWGSGRRCTRFLFQDGALTDRESYVLAVFGTFFLTLAVEVIRYCRVSLARRRGKDEPASMGYMCVQAALYGVQMLVAYTLMLIAMTFDSMLFLTIIIGFMVGNFATQVLDNERAAKELATRAPMTKYDGSGSSVETQDVAVARHPPCCDCAP